jgi:hypothetical protein
VAWPVGGISSPKSFGSVVVLSKSTDALGDPVETQSLPVGVASMLATPFMFVALGIWQVLQTISPYWPPATPQLPLHFVVPIKRLLL